VRILLLLDKEYNSLQCLILHEVIRPDFEIITEGKYCVFRKTSHHATKLLIVTSQTL